MLTGTGFRRPWPFSRRPSCPGPNPRLWLLVFWFAYTAFSTPVFLVTGYEEAGKYIAQNPRGKSVLYYGNYDGSFMMGIRRNVSSRGPYILRGDRQLAIRYWWGKLHDENSIKSQKEILSFLDHYCTGYAVVENNMPRAESYQEYINLMRCLQNNEFFEEVETFPIKSNFQNLGNELVIYKFKLNKKMVNKAETLIIPVPTLQTDLRIPF